MKTPGKKETGMANCECLNDCVFFNDNMEDMPGMAGMYKEKFCKGDNTTCARYIVMKKLGKENIPPDLFPNQKSRAQELISAVQK